MAMLVYRSVPAQKSNKNTDDFVDVVRVHIWAHRSPRHDSQMITGILLFSFSGDFAFISLITTLEGKSFSQ